MALNALQDTLELLAYSVQFYFIDFLRVKRAAEDRNRALTKHSSGAFGKKNCHLNDKNEKSNKIDMENVFKIVIY